MPQDFSFFSNFVGAMQGEQAHKRQLALDMAQQHYQQAELAITQQRADAESLRAKSTELLDESRAQTDFWKTQAALMNAGTNAQKANDAIDPNTPANQKKLADTKLANDRAAIAEQVSKFTTRSQQANLDWQTQRTATSKAEEATIKTTAKLHEEETKKIDQQVDHAAKLFVYTKALAKGRAEKIVVDKDTEIQRKALYKAQTEKALSDMAADPHNALKKAIMEARLEHEQLLNKGLKTKEETEEMLGGLTQQQWDTQQRVTQEQSDKAAANKTRIEQAAVKAHALWKLWDERIKLREANPGWARTVTDPTSSKIVPLMDAYSARNQAFSVADSLAKELDFATHEVHVWQNTQQELRERAKSKNFIKDADGSKAGAVKTKKPAVSGATHHADLATPHERRVGATGGSLPNMAGRPQGAPKPGRSRSVTLPNGQVMQVTEH